MKRAKSLFAAFTLMALGHTAQAGIVYDNGPGDQLGGVGVSADVNVDDFTLADTTSLSGLNVTVLQDASFDYTATPFDIQYIFYSDNGGSPLAGGFIDFGVAQNVTTVGTGNSAFGLDEYVYSFDFQNPVTLSGGTYWLTMFFLTSDFVVWESTTPTHGNPSLFETDGDFGVDGPWAVNGGSSPYDLAFSLVGERIVASPAPLALMGIGMLTLVGLRGRRA